MPGEPCSYMGIGESVFCLCSMLRKSNCSSLCWWSLSQCEPTMMEFTYWVDARGSTEMRAHPRGEIWMLCSPRFHIQSLAERLFAFFQAKILSSLKLFGFNACHRQKLFQKKSLLEVLGKAWTRKSETLVGCSVFSPVCIETRLYCSGVLFWCIVVADNWSNNPGHSGLALSGWRSLYYWIPALFTAPLTSVVHHSIQFKPKGQDSQCLYPGLHLPAIFG